MGTAGKEWHSKQKELSEQRLQLGGVVWTVGHVGYSM